MSVRILCFGDSNTWGFSPQQLSKDYNLRFDSEHRWTGVLQNILGKDYTIIEEGHNGRTTVFDDPIEINRNGIKFIDACLETHEPVDIVIIMLGTNDLKPRLCGRAHDSARGIKRLIESVENSKTGRGGRSPKILVISPVLIGENIEQTGFFEEFGGKAGHEQSKLFSKYILREIENKDCYFLNAADYAEPGVDGIHMEEKDHSLLAHAIADKIKEISLEMPYQTDEMFNKRSKL